MRFRTLLGLVCLLLLSCKKPSPGFQGYVEGENTFIASPYGGILLSLAVGRGDWVNKGQFLAELDPNPQAFIVKQYQDTIQEANHRLNDLKNPLRTPEILAIKAQIEQIDADLQLAALRVDRYRQLQNKNAIDKDALDQAEANLAKQANLKKQYLANLQLAQMGGREEQVRAQQEKIAELTTQYEQAVWQLAQKKLRAPVSGMVFDTYFQVGEFVADQQAVLSLLNPADIYVEFFAPLEAMQTLKMGQKLRVTNEEGSYLGLAFIRYISPDAEYLPPLVYSRDNSDKLVFRIQASLEEARKYKPGQPLRVYRDE